MSKKINLPIYMYYTAQARTTLKPEDETINQMPFTLNKDAS